MYTFSQCELTPNYGKRVNIYMQAHTQNSSQEDNSLFNTVELALWNQYCWVYTMESSLREVHHLVNDKEATTATNYQLKVCARRHCHL